MSSTASAGSTLERLRAHLVRDGEAIAPAVAGRPGDEVIGPLVRACAGADATELTLVMESILEGYLLHYGRPRLVETPDRDLRLLAGDHLYAVGLSRLARLGDLDAVRALADLITLCARAHADAGADGGAGHRSAALWLLTALAVAGGRWPGYARAIAAAHGGRGSSSELLAEARQRAAQAGVQLEAEAALIAFQHAVSAAAPASDSGYFPPNG